MTKEVKEDKTCTCGEDCKCKKGKVRKVIFTILLVLVFAVIAFGVGVATGGFILVDDNKVEAEGNEATETLDVYLGKNNEYIFIEEAKKLTLGDNFVNFIINFRSVGPDAVTRKEFFEERYYMLAYVGSFYSDAQRDQYTVTKKDNILKNVKELFSIDFGEEFDEVKSISVTNGYNFGDMSCISEYCYIFAAAGGEIYGPQYVNTIVNEEVVGENTVYTVKEFYMGYGYNGKRDIFVEKDGEQLLSSSEISEYEDLIKVVSTDKLNTYKFTFDKDGKFVSCETVK